MLGRNYSQMASNEVSVVKPHIAAQVAVGLPNKTCPQLIGRINGALSKTDLQTTVSLERDECKMSEVYDKD